MKKKATINEVAKMAGVSIATVSRAINGNYPVKSETKKKIFEAIKELDFKPNELAVSMITKKTNTIGVVVPSITNAFFNTLIKGISHVTEKNGYTLLVCTSDNNEMELVEKLVNRQVDGIIIADSNIEEKKDFYKKIHKDTKIIFINGYDEDFNYVSVDQIEGTKKALHYLLDKGHKEILFIRGSENSYSYNLKEKIFKELCNTSNILVVDSGNKDEAIINVKKAVKNFFSMEKKCSAIFACNDLMAIGAIKGLQELLITIPKEVAVMGFDNIFLCDLISPTISTVDQNIFELGKICAENLLKLIEKNDKVNILLGSELVIRESS